MGQLTNPPAEQASGIYHFAHHHHQQLSHNHHHQTPCSACCHPASVPAYSCLYCNFFLHVECAKMPQQLPHPFDSNKTHSLMLLPRPAYQEGIFSCDACGHKGNSLSYHCSDCSIDLHVWCATLPSVAAVPGHHHQLGLAFNPPYPDRSFCCDVCGHPGSKTWLYHCGNCQFDVHLGCASSAKAAQPQSLTQQTISRSLPPQQFVYTPSVPGVPVVQSNQMPFVAAQLIYATPTGMAPTMTQNQMPFVAAQPMHATPTVMAPAMTQNQMPVVAAQPIYATPTGMAPGMTQNQMPYHDPRVPADRAITTAIGNGVGNGIAAAAVQSLLSGGFGNGPGGNGGGGGGGNGGTVDQGVDYSGADTSGYDGSMGDTSSYAE